MKLRQALQQPSEVEPVRHGQRYFSQSQSGIRWVIGQWQDCVKPVAKLFTSAAGVARTERHPTAACRLPRKFNRSPLQRDLAVVEGETPTDQIGLLNQAVAMQAPDHLAIQNDGQHPPSPASTKMMGPVPTPRTPMISPVTLPLLVMWNDFAKEK